MARRAQFQPIVAGDMSADINAVFDMRSNYACAIQCICTTNGTLAGTFNIQGSADYQQDNNGNVLNTGHWSTLTSQTATISGAGTTPFDITTTGYGWLRINYTHHSGDTGSLNAFVQVKGYYQ